MNKKAIGFSLIKGANDDIGAAINGNGSGHQATISALGDAHTSDDSGAMAILAAGPSPG